MVNALAYRLLGRDDELDDLVQESFVDALGSLARLREPQAFAAWMASIVVGRTAKLLRRRKLMSRLGLRRPMDPIDVDALVSSTAPPDEAAELRAVYRLVDALPTDVRIALVLRRVDGHSLEEIATLTGTSLATVKRKIAAGDLALRDAGGAR